jgi:hypothetical protein
MFLQIGNLGEMDKFLERCKLSNLTPEEAVNMKRPVTSEEIGLIIKKIAHKAKLGT